MAEGLRQIAQLPDLIGEISEMKYRPTGIQVGKMRVPLGVGRYYLRIASECDCGCCRPLPEIRQRCHFARRFRSDSSNQAIAACVHAGLRAAGLPETAIQVVNTTDRAAVGELITMKDMLM